MPKKKNPYVTGAAAKRMLYTQHKVKLLEEMDQLLPGDLTMEDMQTLLHNYKYSLKFAVNLEHYQNIMLSELLVSRRAINALHSYAASNLSCANLDFVSVSEFYQHIGQLHRLQHMSSCGEQTMIELKEAFFLLFFEHAPNKKRFMANLVRLNFANVA